MAQAPCSRQALHHRLQPALNGQLLMGKALAIHPPSFEAGQAAQGQHAAHRVGANLQGQGPGFATTQHTGTVPSCQTIGPGAGQQSGKLWHAGLEMVIHLEQIIRPSSHLFDHPFQPGRSTFQISHPNDVVKRHPQGHPARHLARDRPSMHGAGIAGGLGLPDLAHAAQIHLAIRAALVIGDTCQAQGQHGARGLWKVQQGCLVRRAQGAGSTLGQGLSGHLGPLAWGVHRVICQRKTAQTGRRLGPLTNRGFKMRALKRQQATARNRPQHHRTDHGSRLLGHAGHVQHMVLLAKAAHHIDQLGAVAPPIGQLHAFVGGETARARCDDAGAIG